MSPKRPDDVVRFDTRQRLEHLSVMLLFVVLALTGFPQKFPEARWAPALAGAVGGIEAARVLHRAAGLLFALLALAHLGSAALGAARRRVPLSMVPAKKDFQDAIGMLRYYMGAAPARPRLRGKTCGMKKRRRSGWQMRTNRKWKQNRRRQARRP